MGALCIGVEEEVLRKRLGEHGWLILRIRAQCSIGR